MLPGYSQRAPHPTFDSPLIRVLLHRYRLRLPLPLFPFTGAQCRCWVAHDALGDHIAACPRSGALLERAAARVCHEAGATVATNARVRDLNVVTERQDERRIEVIANELPLWGGCSVGC